MVNGYGYHLPDRIIKPAKMVQAPTAGVPFLWVCRDSRVSGARGAAPCCGKAANVGQRGKQAAFSLCRQALGRAHTPARVYLVPNEVFNLGLSSHEIAVYNYLLRCEDRRTYQCHPSYRTIGRAVQLSENTVRKYVAGLEEKGLIRTEPSTIITKDGRMRNGSLIYTIRPIQEALEQNYQRQFRQAEESVERARVQKRLAELEQRSNVKKEESA